MNHLGWLFHLAQLPGDAAKLYVYRQFVPFYCRVAVGGPVC